MKYEKPSVLLLGPTIASVQSHNFKSWLLIPDLATFILRSNAAYEADE
jgi:hypothetical protein